MMNRLVQHQKENSAMVSMRRYLLAVTLLLPLNCMADGTPPAAFGPGGAVDTFETINRASWKLNYEYLDRYALRPVVHSYVAWVPQPVRNGVGNFTENFNEANYFINNLLVGRPADSGVSVLRFALNSTVGLLGFVDVAQDMGIERRSMNMSTVLGKATVTQGPYFMIPVYGPTTMRTLVGDTVDGLYFPYASLGWGPRIGLWAVDGLSKRAKLVDQEALLDNALDPYVSAKDFYLQYEEAKVQEGRPQASHSEAERSQSGEDQNLDQYLNEIDQ
jgi:phospholipid-binding lipoprotein MlaA